MINTGTFGQTREAAIQKMEVALDSYVVHGLGNNLTFLRDVMRNAKFRSGKYSTKFIEMEYPEGFSGVKLNEDETHQLVATACAINHAKLDLARGEEEYGDSMMGQHGEGGLNSGDDVIVVLGKDEEARSFLCTMILGGSLQVEITPLDKDTQLPNKGAQPTTIDVRTLDWLNESPRAMLEFGDGTEVDEFDEVSLM